MTADVLAEILGSEADAAETDEAFHLIASLTESLAGDFAWEARHRDEPTEFDVEAFKRQALGARARRQVALWERTPRAVA